MEIKFQFLLAIYVGTKSDFPGPNVFGYASQIYSVLLDNCHTMQIVTIQTMIILDVPA